jgi:hypothetical protein
MLFTAQNRLQDTEAMCEGTLRGYEKALGRKTRPRLPQLTISATSTRIKVGFKTSRPCRSGRSKAKKRCLVLSVSILYPCLQCYRNRAPDSPTCGWDVTRRYYSNNLMLYICSSYLWTWEIKCAEHNHGRGRMTSQTRWGIGRRLQRRRWRRCWRSDR